MFRHSRRTATRADAAAVACLLLAHAAAWAQPADWPQRPVRMIVPFPPGGGNDLTARIVQPALSDALGQPFVVDNRPGAAGNIGTELVARSAPDGYNVLVGNVSTNSVNPTGFRDVLKFDLAKELTGVVQLARIPNVMVAAASFPPNTLKDLIEYTRARPGQLNYSNPIGAYSHLDMLDFLAKTGLQMVNVPSKGAGATVAALLNGEVHFYFTNAATVMPHILAGRMKAFVTTAPKRLPELPQVPTMAEAGFPGMGSELWIGLFVQSRTPRAIVDRLDAAVQQIALRPAVREAFDKANIPLVLSKTPEAFQAFVAAETKKWARVIRDNGVTFQ